MAPTRAPDESETTNSPTPDVLDQTSSSPGILRPSRAPAGPSNGSSTMGAIGRTVCSGSGRGRKESGSRIAATEYRDPGQFPGAKCDLDVFPIGVSIVVHPPVEEQARSDVDTHVVTVIGYLDLEGVAGLRTFAGCDRLAHRTVRHEQLDRLRTDVEYPLGALVATPSKLQCGIR